MTLSCAHNQIPESLENFKIRLRLYFQSVSTISWTDTTKQSFKTTYNSRNKNNNNNNNILYLILILMSLGILDKSYKPNLLHYSKLTSAKISFSQSKIFCSNIAKVMYKT